MNQRFRKLVGSTRRSSNQSVNGSNLAAITSNSAVNTANSSTTNLARTAQINSANSLPSTAGGSVNGTAAAPRPVTDGAPSTDSVAQSVQSNQGVASTAGARGPPVQQQQQQPPLLNTPPAVQNNSSSPPPMNNQPLGRPPSYSHSNSANPAQLGAPQYQGQRANSPMAPPPINTGGAHYPQQAHPQQQQPMYAQPPQYPMAQPAYGYGAPQAVNPHYARGQMAEVEGSNRSKAQLIVGIDFVSYRYHKAKVYVEY